MEDIPYLSERMPVSASQLRAWRGRRVGTALRLSGPCPACRHLTPALVPLSTDSLEARGPESSEQGAGSSVTVVISCHCERDHPGRPDAPPAGCGRTWAVGAEVDASGDVSLCPADDPYLTEAAEAFRAAQAGQLDRLRAAAEKWIGGITALLGLLGVIGVSLGADQIRKLEASGRLLFALSVAVAVVAGGLGIQRAYRAAYGWPRQRPVGTDAELLAWYGAQRELPAAVAAGLRTAGWAAALALVALAVAANLTWLLPEAEPRGPVVQVTTGDQSIFCGTLLPSRADGALRLRRAADGTAVTIAAAEVRRLAPATAC